MSQNSQTDRQSAAKLDVIFKPFPIELDGYEDRYLVTNDGRVYSNFTNKFLKPFYTRGGYVRVKVNWNNKNRKFQVHRLVALAFIPNDDPEHKTQVDHINCNRTDNRVENLRWVTPSENSQHALAVGSKDSMMYVFRNVKTGQKLEFSNRHKILKYFANVSMRNIRNYAINGKVIPVGPCAGYTVERYPIKNVQRPSSAEEQGKATRNGNNPNVLYNTWVLIWSDLYRNIEQFCKPIQCNDEFAERITEQRLLQNINGSNFCGTL